MDQRAVELGEWVENPVDHPAVSDLQAIVAADDGALAVAVGTGGVVENRPQAAGDVLGGRESRPAGAEAVQLVRRQPGQGVPEIRAPAETHRQQGKSGHGQPERGRGRDSSRSHDSWCSARGLQAFHGGPESKGTGRGSAARLADTPRPRASGGASRRHRHTSASDTLGRPAWMNPIRKKREGHGSAGRRAASVRGPPGGTRQVTGGSSRRWQAIPCPRRNSRSSRRAWCATGRPGRP